MPETDAGIGLLCDILADPFADDVRLIYADWLEDHGEELRAEYIRAGIELAGVPEPELKTIGHLSGEGLKSPWHPGGLCQKCEQVVPRYCKYHTLRRWQQSIVDRTPWKPGWWSAPPVSLIDSTASRGFVSSVSLYCHLWEKLGPELVLRQPIIAVVLADFQTRAEYSPQLSGKPHSFISMHPIRGDSDFWPWCKRSDGTAMGFTAKTESDMRKLVSRTAVNWARRTAGLPELNYPIPSQPKR